MKKVLALVVSVFLSVTAMNPVFAAEECRICEENPDTQVRECGSWASPGYSWDWFSVSVDLRDAANPPEEVDLLLECRQSEDSEAKVVKISPVIRMTKD